MNITYSYSCGGKSVEFNESLRSFYEGRFDGTTDYSAGSKNWEHGVKRAYSKAREVVQLAPELFDGLTAFVLSFLKLCGDICRKINLDDNDYFYNSYATRVQKHVRDNWSCSDEQKLTGTELTHAAEEDDEAFIASFKETLQEEYPELLKKFAQLSREDQVELSMQPSLQREFCRSSEIQARINAYKETLSEKLLREFSALPRSGQIDIVT